MSSVFKKSLEKSGTRLSDYDKRPSRLLPGEQIVEIDPALIDYEPQQRTAKNPGMTVESLTEFGQELKSTGQQQPAIVRPNPKKPGRFIMVAGERRGRACSLADIKLKVIIRELTDEQVQRIQRVENIHREALTNEEIATSLREDQKRLGTQAAVAALWGKSINWVSERLKFLDAVERGGAAAQAIVDGVSADVSTLNELSRLERRDAAAAQHIIDQAKADPAINVRGVVRDKLRDASASKPVAGKRPGRPSKQSSSGTASPPVTPPPAAPVRTTMATIMPARYSPETDVPMQQVIAALPQAEDKTLQIVREMGAWTVQGGSDGIEHASIDTLVARIWNLDPTVKIQLIPSA